jgi:hypothetical protein
MPAQAVFPLTLRLTARKLRSSGFTVAVSALLPILLAFLGVRASFGTAMKLFLFFCPYVFLLAAQDMVGTELAGGALENVLFLGGAFRTYLWQKNFALAALAGAYASALFALLGAWGLAIGRFDPVFLLQFALALLGGFYYIGLAGALSHFLKAGSNVVMILLAQFGAFISLLYSATSRTGFIDCLETGRFPGLGPRLEFFGFVAVFPNLAVSPRLAAGGFLIAAGLALALLFQRVRLRRLELRK